MAPIPFIKYAIMFMNRLSFVKKFIVVSILFSLPLLILGQALFYEIKENINTTKAEREGIVLLQKSYELLFAAAAYRDIQLVARANGSEEVQARIASRAKIVDHKLSDFEKEITGLSNSGLPEQLSILHKNWDSFKTGSAGAAGGPNIQFQYYDSLVNSVELMVNVVTYDRKLIHDPSLKTFLLINIMIKDIPSVIRSLGKARAYGAYSLSLTALDYETFKTLDKIYDELIANKLLIEQSLKYTLDLNNQNKDLEKVANNLVEGITAGSDYFYLNLIEKDFIDLKWNEYFDAMSESFTRIHDVINIILPAIDQQLANRIEQQYHKLYLFLFSTILLSILIFYLYSAVYFSIRSHISAFAYKASQVAAGDLTVKMDIASKDELSELYSAFNDMLTQLREHQDKLMQAEKMASLGSMIAGVAHEMNTPMGIIKTATSQIQESMVSIGEKFNSNLVTKNDFQHYLADSQECMTLISLNTERCISLISTFKQLNIYQKSEINETIELTGILNEIPSLFKHDNSHVKIEISHPPSLQASIDPELLTLVIGNLIGNAYAHGFTGKDSGIIKVIGTQTPTNICIEVTDNGNGIDESNLEKVFEPFFTTKRNQGNVGLGLHIVYIVVTQALKGDIQINSQPDGGTQVVMCFKHAKVPQAS
ncbi:MAG: signal transduction histidine kinase [Oceanicoccus sp.]|jgi:signal transduction histidine kinase